MTAPRSNGIDAMGAAAGLIALSTPETGWPFGTKTVALCPVGAPSNLGPDMADGEETALASTTFLSGFGANIGAGITTAAG